MSDIAIRVQNLSKQFRIGGLQIGHKTLRESLTDAVSTPLRRLSSVVRGQSSHAASETIWALRDVSFEVKRGDVVGIIGANGAGKTTLLRILSRITEPTQGTVDLHGRVGSLLEVGTGFHSELTGRENIYLNGAILGMKRAEIGRKFDEIVDFSGVEKFIDTPVKHYSSGMYLRLAFAVAAHLDPEILLVDEVLAVGDAAFQKKCLGKMGDVAREGRTVLFVSHNMPAISALSSEALMLDTGRVRFEGETSYVVRQYLSEMHKLESVQLEDRDDRLGNGRIRFGKLEFSNSRSSSGEGSPIAAGHDVDIVLAYESDGRKHLRNVAVAVIFADSSGRRLFTCFTEHQNASFEILPPRGQIICHIDRFPLLDGKYQVMIWSSVEGQLADRIENAGIIEVAGDDFFGSGRLPRYEKHGPFLVDHAWHSRP
ncbi:MAG: ABC transporter ATP-binding protein [Anaerolineales bacterium]